MLTVSYDSSVLELKNATIGRDFTKVANAEILTRTENGKVMLNWVTTDSWFYGDGEFAQLTFLVKEGSEGKSADITAVYDPDNVFDGHFINIDLTMESGSAMSPAMMRPWWRMLWTPTATALSTTKTLSGCCVTSPAMTLPSIKPCSA